MGSCFNLADGVLHTSRMHVDSLSAFKPLKASAFRARHRAPANRLTGQLRDRFTMCVSPPPTLVLHQCQIFLVFSLRRPPAIVRHIQTVIGCLLALTRSNSEPDDRAAPCRLTNHNILGEKTCLESDHWTACILCKGGEGSENHVTRRYDSDDSVQDLSNFAILR